MSRPPIRGAGLRLGALGQETGAAAERPRDEERGRPSPKKPRGKTPLRRSHRRNPVPADTKRDDLREFVMGAPVGRVKAQTCWKRRVG